MSNTRRALANAPLSQERYASAIQSGMLLGNLVAKKCEATKNAKHRRLLFFLHDLSLRAGCAAHPTCNQFPAWPFEGQLEHATAFDRIAADLESLFPEALKSRAAIKKMPAFLTHLCLDPRVTFESAQLPGCPDVLRLLERYRIEFCSALTRTIARTEPTIIITEALDYALELRHGGIVLIEGTWRVGKSYSAQSWAQAHVGECRYVQLSSGRDDNNFYRDISRALGTAHSSQRKASEMRMRIESVLRTQALLLILDEAQYIWPQTLRPQSPPDRVNWLITALLNNGATVALVASHDFTRMMRNVERNCPLFGSEQFYGRLRLRKRLPDQLSEDDLFKIAESMIPESTKGMRMLLVAHALKSKGRIAAIETAVERARFFADQEDRTVTFGDVERAMEEAGTISPKPGRCSAIPSRDAREDRAARSPGIGADRLPQVSPLIVGKPEFF